MANKVSVESAPKVMKANNSKTMKMLEKTYTEKMSIYLVLNIDLVFR